MGVLVVCVCVCVCGCIFCSLTPFIQVTNDRSSKLSLPLPLLVAEGLHSGAELAAKLFPFPYFLSRFAYQPAHELLPPDHMLPVGCPYVAIATAAPACIQWSRVELHIDNTTAGWIDQAYYSGVHGNCSQLATALPENIYLPYEGIYTFWLHFVLTALGQK